MIFSLILIICIQLNLSQSTSYSSDFWWTSDSLSHIVNDTLQIFDGKPCDPCQCFLQIYSSKIVIVVMQPKSNKIFKQQNNLISQNYFVLTNQTYQISIPQKTNQNFAHFISFQLSNGLKWSYKIILPKHSLIIEGQKIQNSIIIPIIIIVIIGLAFFVFPLTNYYRTKFSSQMTYRTPLFSLICSIISLQYLLINLILCAIYYMLNGKSIIAIILAYFLNLFIFSVITIQFGYFLFFLQKVYSQSIPQCDANKRWKRIGFIFFFFFLLGMPFLSFFFNKGLLFHIILSSGFIWQVIYSIQNNKYPYGRSILYYPLIALSLCLLNKFVPLLNFMQIPNAYFLILIIYYLILIVGGIILLKLRIKTEVVNRIIFDDYSLQQKSKEMQQIQQDIKSKEELGKFQIVG